MGFGGKAGIEAKVKVRVRVRRWYQGFRLRDQECSLGLQWKGQSMV